MAPTVKGAAKASKAIPRAPPTTGKLSTTTDEQTPTSASTKSASKDQSPPISVPFTPSRDLTRTPPLSADAPIAGTPTTPSQEVRYPSNCGDVASNSATASTNQNPFTMAENLILRALQKLQTIYNSACKTGNMKQVVIERSTFEVIGTALQNAYK